MNLKEKFDKATKKNKLKFINLREQEISRVS
jgi:hypothetical protein